MAKTTENKSGKGEPKNSPATAGTTEVTSNAENNAAVVVTDPEETEVAVTPAKSEKAVVLNKVETQSVKVKFLKDHTFNIGTKKYEMLKGQTLEVEIHLANGFAARSIAFLVN